MKDRGVCIKCKVVFMLLGKCASMQTSSCALERWYGRWGGGEGPRGEHTPPAYVRLFQNTGQHLVIFYERCAQTRVFADNHPRISGCFWVFFVD